MTRATIITITTLIWSAGFAATGAFVYTVTKPLPTSAVASAPAPSPPRMPHEQQRSVALPALDVVSDIPHASPVKPLVVKTTTASAPTPKPVETAQPHEPRCSEWRALEQGSNSVQICD